MNRAMKKHRAGLWRRSKNFYRHWWKAAYERQTRIRKEKANPAWGTW